MTDFDRDPEALAWARAKIQREIDRADKFVADAKKIRNEKAELTWRIIGNHLRRSFIGSGGCVIAAFDERLPAYRARYDAASTDKVSVSTSSGTSAPGSFGSDSRSTVGPVEGRCTGAASEKRPPGAGVNGRPPVRGWYQNSSVPWCPFTCLQTDKEQQ